MRDKSYQSSVDFLQRFFGETTEHAVELRSFFNVSDDGTAKRVFTREGETIELHCQRFDDLERGMFFGVCTRRRGASKGTYAELMECHALWVDVDCLKRGLAKADVVRALLALPFAPSVVIDSGGGIHGYWMLNEAEAIEGSDRDHPLNGVLAQLAGVVAGDTKVCDLARVMRLPGTLNTKPEVIEADGAPAVVAILSASWNRYDLSDLIDWLDWQRPVLTLPKSEGVQLEDNPFLAASRRMGFKPTLDVEQALAAMNLGGDGDTSIHQTQLRVSASLCAKGIDEDEIISVLLEATRAAAGAAGQAWNWKREEAAIRRMTVDGRVKFGQSAQVISLAEKKEEMAVAVAAGAAAVAVKPRAGDKGALHVMLGQTVIEGLREKGVHILVTAGEVWLYREELWASASRDERQWIDVTIQEVCDALGLTSTNKIISETKSWILRRPELYKHAVEWDSHGMIPIVGGLLDHRTMVLHPASPDQYATWRVEAEYDPAAGCPDWLMMLTDFFGDRTDEERSACIDLLQEMMGMSFIEDKPRALTRALVLEGASETGKSKILDVMSRMTNLSPISTALDSLGGTHGMMEFARRAPWVLHEAFAQGKWHVSSVVKAILTGDPVQINIKNGPLVTRRIRSPIFWGTNHPPQFKEATKAIVNRMIIINCGVVFLPEQPIGIARKAIDAGFSEPSDYILATERSGLLNWALAGVRRARERGFFATTVRMKETLEGVRDDSNIIIGFLRECISYKPSGMVAVPDFCAAFAIWWQENKGEDRFVPSNDSIGRAMVALGDRMICSNTREMRDNKMRYYGGFHLNEIGLAFWEGAASSDLSSGKKTRLSSAKGDVNGFIPTPWQSKPDVWAMMKAHEKSVTASVTHGEAPSPSDASKSDRSPRF